MSRRPLGPGAHSPPPCHVVQSLERRSLLTTLILIGTPENDVISLSVSGGFVIGSINGSETSVPDTKVTDILISADAGDDLIGIVANGLNPTTVNGHAGNDTIRIAPASRDLDDIDAFIMVNGDEGNDRLLLHDDNEPFSPSYLIGGVSVVRSAA